MPSGRRPSTGAQAPPADFPQPLAHNSIPDGYVRNVYPWGPWRAKEDTHA
jgi:hypothetical protein